MILKLIYIELIKVKRYHILWIGFLLSLFSPLLSIYQLSFQSTNIAAQDLINNTVWNNTILFFPLISVIVGGYIINREYTDDTLKNILTVPVSRKCLVAGKVFTVLFVSVIFGLCDFIFTMLIAAFANPFEMGIIIMFRAVLQIVGMSIFSTIAVAPIIIFCAGRRDIYISGILLTFVYAYAGSFFAGRDLQDFYPTTVGLGLVKYIGETGNSHVFYRTGLELVIIVFLIIVSAVMLMLLNHYKESSKS